MGKVDDIIVLQNGSIIEHGTYDELMKSNGHLSHLIGTHSEKLTQANEFEAPDEISLFGDSSKDLFLDASTLLPPVAMLQTHVSEIQLANRRNLSITNSMLATDKNIAKHIELNQLGDTKYVSKSKLKAVASVSHHHEIHPEDKFNEKAMKLVLDDQSVYYNVLPSLSYLKSGSGVTLTLIIFMMFFLVHTIRILSGKLIHYILFIIYTLRF